MFAVQAALAALAMAVLTLVLRGLLTSVTWTAPSAREVARACTRFALPDASPISVVSLLLGSIALAVLVLAARSTIRQLRASRRFLRELGALTQGTVHAAGIFEARAPGAFCAGILRPRVYVSSGAVAQLSGEELDAILAHEAHHARLRDPLRVLFARVLGDALFFLPGVRQLGDRYSALAEMAADQAAIRAAGDRAPLASALLTFESANPAVVGIASERVDHLLGDETRWQLPGMLLAWTLVLLAAVGVLALRLDQVGASTELSLPLFAAQACMLLMALGPLLLGGGAVLGVQRLRATRRDG